MQETQTNIENKEQLFQLLNANVDTIKSYGVSRLDVFGSFVRKEMNEESDVEFYPEKKRIKFLYFFS